MPARSADDVRIETYGGPRDDLRALFELAEDSAAELDSYIDAGRVLVATSDGEIIGHLQLTGTGDPRQVEIKNMAVRETRQGQGIGRRLIQAAVDLAAAESVTTILVATAAADIGNLRFYQRQGFRMRSVERDAFTPATGYPPGLLIDGIELRDRVWLDREVLVRVHPAGYAGHERGRERLQVQGRVVAGPVAYRDHTRALGQQAAGVRDHDRVVIHVRHPRVRFGVPGDVVRVQYGGQAGPDVDELPDAAGRHIADGRPRNCLFSRAIRAVTGWTASIFSASSRSAAKLSFPPSQ